LRPGIGPAKPHAATNAREWLVLIFPAIDLRDGKCVRLRQGDYAQETVFADDPTTMARRWATQGAPWLHLVDLDGAKAGRPINGVSVRAIVQAAGVPCQVGGGLRTEADIAAALGWGAARVIVGTKALKSPAWFQSVCERWPDQVVLGIDARDGKVATQGWLETSEIGAVELAQSCAGAPLAALVYTDISRDGMLEGPNVDAMAAMAAAVPAPVIASGGVTTLEDIRQLAARGLAGCIVGRALYEGRIDLTEALHVAGCGVRTAAAPR
jgi:phosphoribosylformimino-5-aminoimidazole carboxamide ribotide isomerase